MKDLKFASLRGTRTAIHCSTKTEAEQVEKICGFEGIAKYFTKKQSFCISLGGNIGVAGDFGHTEIFEEINYTIIPAAEFIAANSGLNSIDTKPVKNRDIGRNEAREIIGTMSANHKSEPVVIKREAEPPKSETPTAVEWFFDKIKSHFEHDGDLFESITFTLAIAKQKERESKSALMEKIENLEKLINAGIVVTNPEYRHDDLLTAIGQIKAEARRIGG